ncbi:MAG TPA: GAF domain-containing protein, partial [Acidimicrobiales bacterium]|nr:GAF domain-containing protein [Acidimicrobiales bacterium]
MCVVPYRNVRDIDRIQRLLGAVLMIEADVELSDLLAHLVEEACALAGAQYGALGVLNESRTSLAEFITCGLSEEKERAIGSRPTGRGVLGVVVADGENLRLDRIADHPLSVGFPEGHPAMSSFLGVPVRTPSTVYGNLYLTNKLDAERFSEDDEALVEALAQAAAIAIENNRLRERLRLMSVIEDRDRIARELHDRIIQRIYAIGLALQEASRFAIRDETKAAIARGVDQLDIVINELRATIHQLDHDPLPGGLRRNATELINELAPMLGSRPTLTFAGPIDTTIPLRVADHLLAVLREALTNVAKHA